MHRFFFSSFAARVGSLVTIPSSHEVYHQLTRVLRVRPGSRFVLFNASGNDTVVQIVTIDAKTLTGEIVDVIPNANDPACHICLMQALPNKLEKLEYILQKGVEVGVGEFVFFPSERSQPLKISPAKEARFAAIVQEATEQCWGDKLAPVRFLTSWPMHNTNACGYFFHTTNNNNSERTDFWKNLASANKNTQSYELWVWPEGGWSPTEAQRAEALGLMCVSLGKRILRTETTGMVAAAALVGRVSVDSE